MLVRCSALLFAAAMSAPALAADPPPQRHIVFGVRQDLSTRTRLRQETDITSSFNAPGQITTSGGGGGQTVSGLQSTAINATIAVDVVLVAPDGSIGCDVTYESNGVLRTPVRVWIAPDGRTKWNGKPQDVDPAAAFLLPLLAPQFIPADVLVGAIWRHDREEFSVDRVNDGLARISVKGDFGAPSHGGTETGWIDYQTTSYVPTKIDLSVQSHQDLPMKTTVTNAHVTYALISDSFATGAAVKK
jgi:hypothetical protein